MSSNAPGAEKRRVSLTQVPKAAPVVANPVFEVPDRASELWDKVERCYRGNLDLEVGFPELPPEESWSTLLAMRAQIVQTEVKKSTHIHKKNMLAYVQRYRRGNSALSIARAEHYPPYLLIKALCPLIEPELQTKKKITRDIINDDRLRREFKECEEADLDYAPCIDRIRQTIGDEYEFKLQRELRALGAVFQHEDDLRESGFRKTPDALFTVPLAVDLEKVYANDPWARKLNGPLSRKYHIIRWIDSKAMFGNYYTHCVANKEQLQGYVGRFGPGMVVYWFGFDFRGDSAFKEVLVVSKFPADAIVMPCS